MKYLPILIFCLACTAPKATPYQPYQDARFDQPHHEKLAILDNGDYVGYQYIADKKDAYPQFEYIGHGRIYAIAGIMQLGKTEYHFFKDKPKP